MSVSKISASSQVQPKSILKKTQPPVSDLSSSSAASSPSIPVPKSDQDKRNLAIAIEQAHLIQDQKDVVAENLNAIEELSEYPASSTPTEQEIKSFLTKVMQFQPSDYNNLIEERHVNNRCGFTLCPNPPRKTDLKRPWLRPKGSENWCCNDCAKRALYVKAQLDEVPAWERRGGASPAIVLYDEEKLAASNKAASEQDQRRKEQRELALERGEGRKVAAFKIDSVATTEILENTSVATPTPPVSRPVEDEAHNLIEGYQPKGVQDKGANADAGGVKIEETGTKPALQDADDYEDEDADADDEEEDTDLLPFCPSPYAHLG